MMTDKAQLYRDRLRDWCAWLAACAAARDAGIWPVVEALVAGAIAPKQARELTRVAHARGWVNAVVGADPVLASFRGLSHRQQVDRFRELDARLTAAATVETRERLARAVPRKGDVGEDRPTPPVRNRLMTPPRLFSLLESSVVRLATLVLIVGLPISALATPAEPGRRPMARLAQPLSLRLLAWAWPWLP